MDIPNQQEQSAEERIGGELPQMFWDNDATCDGEQQTASLPTDIAPPC